MLVYMWPKFLAQISAKERERERVVFIKLKLFYILYLPMLLLVLPDVDEPLLAHVPGLSDDPKT